MFIGCGTQEWLAKDTERSIFKYGEYLIIQHERLSSFISRDSLPLLNTESPASIVRPSLWIKNRTLGSPTHHSYHQGHRCHVGGLRLLSQCQNMRASPKESDVSKSAHIWSHHKLARKKWRYGFLSWDSSGWDSHNSGWPWEFSDGKKVFESSGHPKPLAISLFWSIHASAFSMSKGKHLELNVRMRILSKSFSFQAWVIYSRFQIKGWDICLHWITSLA